MKNYMVKLKIVGECEADVRELIQQFTGEETDVEIITIEVINKEMNYMIIGEYPENYQECREDVKVLDFVETEEEAIKLQNEFEKKGFTLVQVRKCYEQVQEQISEEEWKQIKKDDMEMDAHEGEMLNAEK